MWISVLTLLLIGAASAEHNHAWDTEKEYHYTIESRTLTGLHGVSNQYTGILMRGHLKIQPRSQSALIAKLSKMEYAQVHTELPGGWDSKVPDGVKDHKPMPMSGKPFEITMKHGTIREINIDKDVPTWEVNVLKSIVSQLQIDTQGENMMKSRNNQPPKEDRTNAMYKAMEDSVAGRCEVLYDINEIPRSHAEQRIQRLPGAEFKSDGEVYEIRKTRDYANCEQRRAVHYGITGKSGWEPGSSKNGDFLSKSSVSEATITGNPKAFTVHSSVTTEMITLSPNVYDKKTGMVGSRVSLTLFKVHPATNKWPSPSKPESVGNLVYTYDRPFSPEGDDRSPGRPSVSESSNEESSSRASSSEEKPHKHHYDDSSSSSSSDASDNNSLDSSASKDANDNCQPKPTLNEAPQYPMLPLFIGNKGKSLWSSADIDLTTTAKTLASQIGSEVQNPNSIPQEQTLEKFTTLTEVLRTMSTNQMREVQKDMYQSSKDTDPNDEGQNVKRNTWMALRDAVASAGTGPALMIITEWIKDKRIDGAEAARVVSVLSKTAKEPTPEYINAVFKMATMPEVLNDRPLSEAAIMTFSELVRYAQVNCHASHNRYPSHTFGSFCSKNNDALFRDYFPYLIENFEKGMKENDYRGLMYMRAMGNIAHPKIIGVFEPYFEGRKPSTSFQRFMMVMCLDQVTNLHPRTMRGILYRIYQNTGEAPVVRTVATILLSRAHPSAAMLQRMAQFTNYDVSKQVNSMVKAMIENMAKFTNPEHQKLAQYARSAKPLLTPENYGMEYSRAFLRDGWLNDLNIGYIMEYGWIGSDDSYIPMSFYAGTIHNYGGFRAPRDEMFSGISSMKNLWDKVQRILGKKQSDDGGMQSGGDRETEEFAEMLHIEGKKKEKVQGLLQWRDKFSNAFLSFDEDMMDSIPEHLKNAATALKSGKSFNTMCMRNYAVMVSFPTESGLPFYYDFQMPQLKKMSGRAKANSNPDYSQEPISKPNKIEASAEVRMVNGQKIQSRFGFVAPFERQKYMSGVDSNVQFHIPFSANIKYDGPTRQVQVKLQAMDKNEEAMLLHYSVVPFIARQDIADLKPTASEKRPERIVMKKDVEEFTRMMGGMTRGMAVRIYEERPRDSPTVYDTIASLEGLEAGLLFPLSRKGAEYRVLDAYVSPSPSSEQSIVINVAWDRMLKNEKSDESSRSKPQAMEPKNKEPMSSARRSEMMSEALRDLPAAQAMAVDMNVEFPGQEPVKFGMTASFAKSKIDERYKALLYLRADDGTPDRTFYEACAAAQGSEPELSPFDHSETEREKLKRSIDIELKFGSRCSTADAVRIQGRQWQSKELREAMKSNPKMYEANGIPPTLMDRMMLRLENSEDNPRKQKEQQTSKESEFDDDAALVNITIDARNRRAKWQVTPALNKYVFDDGPRSGEVKLEKWMIAGLSADSDEAEEMMDSPEGGSNRHRHAASRSICKLEKDYVSTFDGAEYSFNMTNCIYVAMTASPERESDSSSAMIRPDKSISVVIRKEQSDEAKREVFISLGKTPIHMTQTGSEIQVHVNRQPVQWSNGRYTNAGAGMEDEWEMAKTSKEVVILRSKKYGLEVIYDGRRIHIQVSNKHRDGLRGLCGNFDGESANDFLTPRNRLSPKPDDFTVLYALPRDSCKAVGQSEREAEKQLPLYKPRLSNVISDRDAGRTKHGEQSWGYPHDAKPKTSPRDRYMTVRTRIIPGDEQTCFSLRPLPTCAPGAQASRVRMAMFPVYCIPNGESAKRMSDRINRGANPDLSQKSPSMKIRIEIPEKCSPAA